MRTVSFIQYFMQNNRHTCFSRARSPTGRLVNPLQCLQLVCRVSKRYSIRKCGLPSRNNFTYVFSLRFTHPLMLGSGVHTTGIPHPAIVPHSGSKEMDCYERNMWVYEYSKSLSVLWMLNLLNNSLPSLSLSAIVQSVMIYCVVENGLMPLNKTEWHKVWDTR